MIQAPHDTLDWTWDGSIMEDEKTKDELRNNPFASLELVYQIVWRVAEIIGQIATGGYSMLSLICDTKDMWDATNFARLWPESNHEYIDTRLQDAMAHLAEAYWVIEGSFEWRGHLTESATRYSLHDLKIAVNMLGEAYEALNAYISDFLEEVDGTDEGRKF